MRAETTEQPRPLKSGYTTGACATVTALAAARLLLTGSPVKRCSITLPKGQHVEFDLTECCFEDIDSIDEHRLARASTIKDAGDDPDVTHGATISSHIKLIDSPVCEFKAGSGVGTITLDGLSYPAGEPAINPVPREMIRSHLFALASEVNYPGGFEVTISVANGAALALKTMNPRLGILGGLSILGTTGIVRPFSCSAYIASIQQGIDVALRNGEPHLIACTGSSSEALARQRYRINDTALIEMGDFAGAVLKHLRTAPKQGKLTQIKLSLVGGFGKFTKLAQGHLDLHSRSSSIDFQFLATLAKGLGAAGGLISEITKANTSLQVLSICQKNGIDIAQVVCDMARETAIRTLRQSSSIAVEVLVVDKSGRLVGQSMRHFKQ
ncbi:MAG: cobalt-precorrin-5B (C(1))-methyltransferase [Pseudomonadales bacterium]|uniref:Cobalt-precorrin-5B C(1)-methyltransferase n=1 Tax=Oleiphilus messinensis TaxID=141451 RepID=A0A1Y0I8H1_9GAMM|nr:cobalt-precorrin-5B (C(1))-methyltransferase [Oleiphilus messinensis]ARU56802.1 cobalamin biosynthesis protein CbiD [Oleiphilus messinensis]MCG8609686.1 cobalt-precorrin-5B (C(1))-methyltransferase [Pseudomonadales bacterium]